MMAAAVTQSSLAPRVRLPLPPEEARTMAQRIHAVQDAFDYLINAAERHTLGHVRADKSATCAAIASIIEQLIDNRDLRQRTIDYFNQRIEDVAPPVSSDIMRRVFEVRGEIAELCETALRNIGQRNPFGCALLMVNFRAIFDRLIDGPDLRERVMQHILCRLQAEFPQQGKLI